MSFVIISFIFVDSNFHYYKQYHNDPLIQIFFHISNYFLRKGLGYISKNSIFRLEMIC